MEAKSAPAKKVAKWKFADPTWTQITIPDLFTISIADLANDDIIAAINYHETQTGLKIVGSVIVKAE